MSGIEVVVKENEPLEQALKRFKREIEQSGLRVEMRRREHFEKPSEKRKRKMEAARRKMLRNTQA